MSEVSIIGLDIAKHVFHVHGADRKGRAIFSKRISRGKLLDFFAAQPSCTVALEACGGAHHWARQLARLGHEVRLIPSRLCKALCEAAKERRDRCRGDLRSSAAAEHAVRGREERTATGGGSGVSDP